MNETHAPTPPDHQTLTTFGGAQLPSSTAAPGAYSRISSETPPSTGAGSQLASLSAPGDSGWT